MARLRREYSCNMSGGRVLNSEQPFIETGQGCDPVVGSDLEHRFVCDDFKFNIGVSEFFCKRFDRCFQRVRLNVKARPPIARKAYSFGFFKAELV